MTWLKLNDINQLEEIKKASAEKPVLIFKHSTSCSISAMAWDRMSRNWKSDDFDKVTPYYLDLIGYRAISNQIAQDFGIMHESPQVILIKDGKAVYYNSHMGISYRDVMENAVR